MDGLADGLAMLAGFFLVILVVILAGVLVFYILRSMGLYRMAQNAGMQSPWLAWIPVARDYLLGSLCDRAAYCQKGRKWNLAVILPVASGASIVLTGVGSATLFDGVFDHWWYDYSYGSYNLSRLFTQLPSFVGLAVTAVFAVALYHLYKDYAPGNEVALTIVTVLFFNQAVPIILFVLRNRVPLSAQGWQDPYGYGGQPPQGPGPEPYGPPPPPYGNPWPPQGYENPQGPPSPPYYQEHNNSQEPPDRGGPEL